VLIIYSHVVVASYFPLLQVNMASPIRLCDAAFNIEQKGWLKAITHFWKEKIAQFPIGILREVLDGFMQIPSLFTKSFYLQNKLFMEAAFANYNFHSQMLYFLFLIAVRIFSSSMTRVTFLQLKIKYLHRL